MSTAQVRAERMDQRWFERRPSKLLRVRRAFDGEFQAPTSDFSGKDRFVIVLRESDGTISKVDFFATRIPEQDDASLAVIFDLVDRHHREGTNGLIPDADIADATRAVAFLKHRARFPLGASAHNGGIM